MVSVYSGVLAILFTKYPFKQSASVISVTDHNSDYVGNFPKIEIASPFIKVSVEPLIPNEMPKMLEAIRKINKSFTGSASRVEESGDNIILGHGELSLDCIMYDLRKVYSEIEIKVADPVVTFAETVADTSSIKSWSSSSNKMNKLFLVAEPVEKELALELASGRLSKAENLTGILCDTYKWDYLTATGVWGLSMDNMTNMLIDYTIPSEVNKQLLYSVQESIYQGFDWACKEGPLCEEPIRNVKFKIIDAHLASEAVFTSSAQIIPLARRACYSSFLMAAPRLMEPLLTVEVLCPYDCVSAVFTIVAKRRGHIVSEVPKPGTPFHVIIATLPALDSFGFETDIRTQTAGLAFSQSWFETWTMMPGDPLDRTIELKPLEPSTPSQLAREAMIKTRRRKGMMEDIVINKFVDDAELLDLVKREGDFKMYFNN